MYSFVQLLLFEYILQQANITKDHKYIIVIDH